MTLDELKVSQPAIITKVNGEGVLRSRLLEMGVIPHTRVEIIKRAPMGDPIEIFIRCYSLTLRLEDAMMIEVEEER